MIRPGKLPTCNRCGSPHTGEPHWRTRTVNGVREDYCPTCANGVSLGEGPKNAPLKLSLPDADETEGEDP